MGILVCLFVFSVLCAPCALWGEEGVSVVGLWRLMAVMPVGIPSEQTPGSLTEALYYWFHADGTVVMILETPKSKNRTKGLWEQRGDQLLISWENGAAVVLRIIRASNDSMIMSGFDSEPLWFRFSRLF